MKQLHMQLKSYLYHPLFWVVIGVVSCTFSFLYHLSSQNKLRRLEIAAHNLKKRNDWAIQKEEIEKNLLQQLKIADHDYIEKELESLKFLNTEIKKLRLAISSDPQNDLETRLHYLESGQNNLRFREQNFQSLDGFSEVEVIQEHPIEVNRDDLKNLIARIENKSIGQFHPGAQPPDLLIKKFDLLKMGATEETFVINLELVKYEMVHE